MLFPSSRHCKPRTRFSAILFKRESTMMIEQGLKPDRLQDLRRKPSDNVTMLLHRLRCPTLPSLLHPDEAMQEQEGLLSQHQAGSPRRRHPLGLTSLPLSQELELSNSKEQRMRR